MLQLIFMITVILTLMTACQSSPRSYDSAKSLPPVGTIIRLNQSLSIQPDSTRVYIQHGKTQDFSSVDVYQPWCQFYLNQHPDVLKNNRTIQPDQFSVIKSYNEEEMFIAKSTLVASSSWIVSDSSGAHVGSWTLQSIMKLHSTKQPQVVELKCAIYDDPEHLNYLSVKQMQKTLGDIVTIKINQGAVDQLQSTVY